ncbi:MAG: outer membrane lipoprotein-sorting protein [Haloarculaceae archaeon]|jgi:outer membrane lipoprotein-sorting protein
MSPKQSILPGLAVATLLVLAGCSTFVGPLGDQQQQEVADRVEERIQEIDRINATVSMEIGSDSQSISTTTNVKADFESGEYRTEIVRPEEQAGDVTIFNGSAMNVYDASENTYRTFEIDAGGSAGMQTNLNETFDRLIEKTDIIYNKTETIDGSEAHKVTLVPTNESESDVESVTMWIEADRMIPVKIQTTLPAMGGITTTVTFSDVEINPEFDPDTFEFDVPANATVTSASASVDMNTYETRSDLAAATDLALPPATLAEGFSFESGHIISRDGGSAASTTVDLTYTADSDRVSVRITPLGDVSGIEYSEGETVTIDGHTGQYREFGSSGNLMWTCNGTQYLVSGQVEKSTLVSVGQSVGC